MKAARLYGNKDLRIEDIPTPKPHEGEIILESKAAFVCGTDVRMFHNGNPHAAPGIPIVLGHEVSGIVSGIGSGIKQYKIGQRVFVAPNAGCGVCSWCTSGNNHLCNEYKAIGVHIDGAFAQYVRVPAPWVVQGNVIPLGDKTGFDEAALVEPLSCAYSSFERTCMTPGSRVLIIGAGPLGMMHARLARSAGARVFMNDIDQARLECVHAIDPSLEILTSKELGSDHLRTDQDKGFDVCITACPSGDAQKTALEICRMNGRVVFFGGLPKGKSVVGLDTNLIHYKQLTVTGTTRSSISHSRKCLEMIEKGIIIVKDLVTGTYTLDDLPRVLSNGNLPGTLKSLVRTGTE